METTNQDKRIIEVNGIKLEVDLRNARRVDQFKIGDQVKVLVKKYSDTYNTYPGVIVGFDEFPTHPTIIVAYVESDYSETKINFAYINDASKDIEICFAGENEIHLDKAKVLDKLDSEILKAEEKVADLKRKRDYFLNNFDSFFLVKAGV